MYYRVMRWLFERFVRILFWVMGGFHVRGKKNVPRSGGVIVAPNHLSFADPPAVGTAIGRHAWFMGTDELFSLPFVGWLAKLMRGYPVRQDSPDRTALRFTEDLLKRGEAVVIFPEGHVSKDGEFQEVQAGVILLAMRTGVPIVPVGIVGSDRFMPPHQWRIHRAPGGIRVVIGRSIPVEELTGGRRGREALDYGAELLGREIQKLIAEAGGRELPQTAEQSGEAALANKRNCRV